MFLVIAKREGSRWIIDLGVKTFYADRLKVMLGDAEATPDTVDLVVVSTVFTYFVKKKREGEYELCVVYVPVEEEGESGCTADSEKVVRMSGGGAG